MIGGQIEGLVASFHAWADGDGRLVFAERPGAVELTVDTGFTGGIALPQETLGRLQLEFLGFERFRLATGEVVELAVYLGSTDIGGTEVEAYFIAAEPLVGMEFLSSAGSALTLDFTNSRVELTG